MEARQRIEQLSKILQEANYLYYVQDAPVMPDFEYDRKPQFYPPRKGFSQTARFDPKQYREYSPTYYTRDSRRLRRLQFRG